jgi:hypothetical protein
VVTVLNWRRRRGRSFLVVNFRNPQIRNFPEFISSSHGNHRTPVLSQGGNRHHRTDNLDPKGMIRPWSSRWTYLRTRCTPCSSIPPAAVSLRLRAHTNYVNSLTKEELLWRSAKCEIRSQAVYPFSLSPTFAIGVR